MTSILVFVGISNLYAGYTTYTDRSSFLSALQNYTEINFNEYDYYDGTIKSGTEFSSKGITFEPLPNDYNLYYGWNALISAQEFYPTQSPARYGEYNAIYFNITNNSKSFGIGIVGNHYTSDNEYIVVYGYSGIICKKYRLPTMANGSEDFFGIISDEPIKQILIHEAQDSDAVYYDNIVIGENQLETYKLSEYFPLGQGDKWIYAHSTNSVSDYTTGHIVEGTEQFNGATGIKRYKSTLTTTDINQNIPTGDAYVLWGFDSQGLNEYKDVSSTRTHTYTPSLKYPGEMSVGQVATLYYTDTRVSSSGFITTHQMTKIIKLESVEDVIASGVTFSNCLKFNVTYIYDGKESEQQVAWLGKGIGHIKDIYIDSDTTISELISAYVGGKYYGAAAQGPCSATLDGNLVLHLPYLSYVNPFLGTQWFWADFLYEFNPNYLTSLFFKLTGAGIITNPSYSCAASTLSSDLKIHIPN